MNKTVKLQSTPIVNEQIHLFLNQSPFLLVAIVATMLAFVSYFWNSVEHDILWTWLAINLSITLIRIPLVLYYRKHAQRLKPYNLLWGWGFAFFALLSGCVWGSTAWVLMNPQQWADMAFIYILVPTTITGVTVSLAAFFPIYLAYSVSSLSLLMTAMFFRGQTEYYIYGYLILLFFLVNLSFALMINRNLKESIELRFKNIDLIEKLRKQKNLAEKANQDKTRFLAAASHDLRQPMQAMQLFTSTLADKLTLSEQKNLLQHIIHSQNTIADMLDSLLDISKLDAQIVKINCIDFLLMPVFSRLHDEFSDVAKQKGIELRIRATNVCLYSDPESVYRILQNLLSNALRYTHQGGVLLACRQNNNKLSIEVWDTGIGIEEHQLEHIFDEFYQVDNMHRDHNRGLGLGLAIVARLSNLLGSPVFFKSVFAQGSVAKLLMLPGQENNIRQSKSRAETMNNQQVTNRLIMVIDDDREIRKGLDIQLTNWDLQVITASSSAIAIEQLAAQSLVPDLIISDYRLANNENGAQAIHAVRSFINNVQIPAIIITGDTSPQRIKESKASGFPLLHKPVRPAKLKALLNQLLQTA